MAQAKAAAGDRNVLVHGATSAGGQGAGRVTVPLDPGAVRWSYAGSLIGHGPSVRSYRMTTKPTRRELRS